jgi:hypothetical protein
MNNTNAYVFVTFFCILAICVPIFVCWCYCSITPKHNNLATNTPLLSRHVALTKN